MQKSGEKKKKKKKKSPKYFQVYAYLSSISFPTLITRPGLLPHLTMGSLRQNIRMNIECSCTEKNMASRNQSLFRLNDVSNLSKLHLTEQEGTRIFMDFISVNETSI